LTICLPTGFSLPSFLDRPFSPSFSFFPGSLAFVGNLRPTHCLRGQCDLLSSGDSDVLDEGSFIRWSPFLNGPFERFPPPLDGSNGQAASEDIYTRPCDILPRFPFSLQERQSTPFFFLLCSDGQGMCSASLPDGRSSLSHFSFNVFRPSGHPWEHVRWSC